ncbi:MAG TPA: HPr family phosphocarrier protein [bacterium]
MTQNITIPIKSGLHLWEMAELSRIATGFKSQIIIRKGALVADAKKFVEVLTLNEEKGTKLGIFAQGEDADEAILAIHNFAVGKLDGKKIESSFQNQGRS